ncbi:hypothetical protein NP493_688g00014 [Ridgeia piscesae]|uniref:Tetraspanin n=1 Tax=Ridgeia piscesae TaxID=27915 RepID=A0AAD9KR00_RIDPI|nr:hypothetical protein NP493_688g00014 [Ridgeia piscesae]
MLSVGIAIKVRLHIYAELTSIYPSEATYVIIIIGAVIVVVGTMGCCCTAKGSSGPLYAYAVFLMLVFIVELSAAISLFVYRGKVKDSLEDGIKEAMDNYLEKESTRNAIDGIQSKLQCCGRYNYTDWFTIHWEAANKTANSVPASCCIKKNCVHTNLTPNDTSVYHQGCFDMVTTFTQKNFSVLGGVAIGFCFLQLFGSLFACCLARVINKAKYEQVA